MTHQEEWRLDTQHIGRRVLLYDQVESTNTVAAALSAEPDGDGLVVLAEEQTAGRGQPGRRWLCARGEGVLMSVIIYPPSALRRPSILTAWASVAVCETIREFTRAPATIKWPNDVLIEGRKVCGILIEQTQRASAVESRNPAIVGIGINVGQTPERLTVDGLVQAASLAMFAGGRLDRFQVTRRLIDHLDDGYDRMRKGDLQTLEQQWKRRIGLLGQPVRVDCLEQTVKGRLSNLTFEVAEVALAGGGTFSARCEAVRQLQAIDA
jgi:BirA family biotin operon repressor/biotin-[acetyl-CoA-carboxylase] ligase